MTGHHLAQLNVGHLKKPLDAPESAGFMNGLKPINALADASPGFVWRLTDEGAKTRPASAPTATT